MHRLQRIQLIGSSGRQIAQHVGVRGKRAQLPVRHQIGRAGGVARAGRVRSGSKSGVVEIEIVAELVRDRVRPGAQAK